MFQIRKQSFCQRCNRRCPAGTEMTKLQNGKFWCADCAFKPLRSTALHDQTCARCNHQITKGEQRGWAPEIGTWCYYCVNGKDSSRFTLRDAERRELDETLERAKQLRALPSPLSEKSTRELEELTLILKQRFGQVNTVARFLSH